MRHGKSMNNRNIYYPGKEIINTLLIIVGSWKYESKEEGQYKKIY